MASTTDIGIKLSAETQGFSAAINRVAAEFKTAMLPTRVIDLTGNAYGNLAVVSYAGVDKHQKSLWLCRCSCGSLRTYVSNNLRKGNSTTCVECGIKNLNHGMFKTRLYILWGGMKARCHSDLNYTKNNITVCDEWLEFVPFKDWALANGYTDNLSIERIDNKGNYEPSNCKWIPLANQQLNKSTTIRLDDGSSAFALAKLNSVSKNTFHGRIRSGWTPFQAATTPVATKGGY